MTSKRLAISLGCLFASGLYVNARGATIEVRVRPIPSLEGSSYQSTPTVSDGGRRLTSVRSGEAWRFKTTPGDDLLRRLTIGLGSAPPARYEYGPLIANLDSMEAAPATHVERIVLCVVKTGHDYRDAEALWDTRADTRSREDLLELYQRARAVAFGRLNEWKGRWSDVDVSDIKSVYQYLNIVVALAKKSPLGPTKEDLRRSVNWFSDALGNIRPRVHTVVGKVPAESLLAAVDDIERERLARLWRSILKIRPISARCRALEEYYEIISEADVTVPGIDSGHVASAISGCRVAEKGGRKLPAAEAHEIIDRNREALDVTISKAMKIRLQSDIATVSGLSLGKLPPG